MADTADRDLTRLAPLRHALLALHKALLDAEQRSYEKVHGRIQGPGQFLQLVLNDPWFGWLRPLSALVVQIDELLDAREPVPPGAAAELLGAVRALLAPSEEGEGFPREYHRALQEVPDVVLVHREVARLLKSGEK